MPVTVDHSPIHIIRTVSRLEQALLDARHWRRHPDVLAKQFDAGIRQLQEAERNGWTIPLLANLTRVRSTLLAVAVVAMLALAGLGARYGPEIARHWQRPAERHAARQQPPPITVTPKPRPAPPAASAVAADRRPPTITPPRARRAPDRRAPDRPRQHRAGRTAGRLAVPSVSVRLSGAGGRLEVSPVSTPEVTVAAVTVPAISTAPVGVDLAAPAAVEGLPVEGLAEAATPPLEVDLAGACMPGLVCVGG